MALDLDRYPEITYDSSTPEFDDLEDLRLHRKWEVALGYRVFAKLRWGQLGDGHITARDPILTDHFWVLSYGVPFWAATVDNLSLVAPGGAVVDGPDSSSVNYAAYNIHWPILDARRELVSAAHTHTPYGTPWSANVKAFEPISQEACSLVFDQSIYPGEDLEVTSVTGGEAIARAMGDTKLCILRNHGLLTGGRSDCDGGFVPQGQEESHHLCGLPGRRIWRERSLCGCPRDHRRRWGGKGCRSEV